MELTDFLLAQIAMDSSVAFFASQDEELVGSLAEHALSPDDHRLTHAARWRPEAVTAHCDVRRRIVEDAAPWASADCRYGRCEHQIGDADGGEAHWRGVQGWFVLTELALPYADVPDYREEWRP